MGGVVAVRPSANGELSRVAEGKHKGSITGILTDSINRTVISCGLDGKMRVSCEMVRSYSDLLTYSTVLEFYKRYSHI